MATTSARLGIDITATDRTKAAFASTQRGMQNMQRSMNQLKGALAGVAGGNVLEGLTRSLIKANMEVPEVKKAFEGLTGSYQKFAQNVGSAGLNKALVDFSTRVGGMIAGVDGFSSSIGRLLASGVTGLGYVFEGIGRSIAFVSDNMAIFSRAAGIFLAYQLGQQIAWTGMAFLKFAAAVRSTTTLMGMFTVVTSIGKRGLVGLAVAGALIATSFEDVERYLDSLMTSISNAMGPVGETVRKTLQGLGFDTRALNMELAGMVAFGSGIESNMSKSEKSLKAFGRSVRVLDGNLKELKDTTADQAMNSIEQSMSNLSGSLVQAAQGTTTFKEAFTSTINSLIQDLTRLFVNQAFQSFLGMFAGGAAAAVAPPGVGPGGMGFLHFGGPRAAGGPVSPGKAYLVGERGPEIFAPGQSGSIIPNRGSGGSMKVEIHNHGGQVRQQETRGPNGERQLKVWFEAMFDKRLVGESTDRVMGAKYGLSPLVRRR